MKDLFPNSEHPPITKSFLNYAGGKAVLLPQIRPLLPKEINMLVDPFAGGLGFTINTFANKYVANDSIPELISLYNHIKETNVIDMITELKNRTDDRGLKKGKTKEEKEIAKNNFLKLREDYNNGENDVLNFYLLVCCSFCNGMRFTKERKFSHPYGDRYFNDSMGKKLIEYSKRLKTMDIKFCSFDFEKLNWYNGVLNENDFVYVDPPYTNVIADYNQNWDNFKDELRLRNWLDKLSEHKIKWGMSNVLSNKGNVNQSLTDWSSKYNVHHLQHDYSNSYGGNDKVNWEKGTTDEVFICNY